MPGRARSVARSRLSPAPPGGILWSACWIALLSVGTVLAQGTNGDEAARSWTLKSGGGELRIDSVQRVTLRLLAATGGSTLELPLSSDSSGLVNGQGLAAEDLILTSQALREAQAGCTELRLAYKHSRLPLEVEVLYRTWGDTGVFTRQATLRNVGGEPLRMESVPSLSWRLPSGEYTLDYLYRSGASVRQLASEKLGFGRKAVVSTSGRSTHLYSPWFSLRNDTLGLRCAAQLFPCGNWEMFFDRAAGGVEVQLGTRFDFGGAAPLPPGAAFEAPMVAFTCSEGDLDDVANQLHRYQRRYVAARTPANAFFPTQFNTWYPLLRTPTAAKVKQYAEAAAELGLEAFVIDAGWFSNRGSRHDPIFGDWEPDPVTFPKGLREVSDYVHAKGMKFGVWLEIETAGQESRVFREHPDWILKYNGKPMVRNARLPNAYLNFAKPEVRRWARTVIDRLVKIENLDYWRLDHNVNLGDRFDPSDPELRSGLVLYEHLRHFLGFLDEVRAAYPHLLLENCASGGDRFDLSTVARTHTQWISDTVDARASVQLAYGSTLEFLPEASNHWMVGDKADGTVDPAQPPGWWDFMFRVPMNGQFGISSRLLDWTPEIRRRALDNIALYKRLRPVIMGADVYHLTPPPAAGRNPTGWMALQYVQPDHKRSAVLVYRLAQSQATQKFHFRGLVPELRYQVNEEGRSRGAFTGQQLSSDGLEIQLEAEWRSSVIELEPSRS